MSVDAVAAPDEATFWDRRRPIIAALGVTQILAWGSTFYLLAVLARPIAVATGWGYGAIIAGISVGLLVSGLVSVRVGGLIDRYGGRPVLAASSLLLATGLVLLAAAPNLTGYFCAWLVLGAGMEAGLYDAAFSTLGRIFGSRGRSAITALTLWGGFASTVCWPVSAYLVESVGWRGTCLAYAALQIAVALPLHLFVIPAEAVRAPARPQAREDAAGPHRDSRRRRQLVILLAINVTMAGVISSAWSVHLIAILEAQGMTLATAVALGALIGPSQVGARVVEMLGRGRHHPIWTLTAAVVFVALGTGLLWGSFAVPAAALIAFGAGNGIFSIARGTLPLALFGPEGYARLMGRLAMPSLIAQALAPSAAALLMQGVGAHGTLGVLAALALANVGAVGILWLRVRH